MHRLRAGIKIKMSLAFSAVFALLAVVINIYGYQHIRGQLISDNDQYLLSKASSLLEKTEVNPVIIPLPDKDNFIRVFYKTGDKYHIVFESPGLPSGIRTPVQPGVSDTLGLRIAYVRNSRNNNEDNPAELMLIMSGASLAERIHSLISLLFVSTLIIVAIAGCISYLLAGVLLQPLQRIIASASTINSNRLRDLIPVHQSNDELQELTETLNGMLVRIDTSLRQQQAFFASASHELKTPLSILRAEVEVNLNRRQDEIDVRPLLESQLVEIKRLQERVNEFLVVSQLKEGNLRIHRMPVDLSSSVLKVFSQLKPMLLERALHPAVEFDQEAGGFVLMGDEDKIFILMLNLLENAIKYAVAGTIIRCRVFREHEELAIELENVIQEEQVNTDQLQEVYHRESGLPGGAGIGLWLCGEIVRLHGGSLVLRSGGHRFIARALFPV